MIFFVDDSSTDDMILISKGKKNLNPNRVIEMKLNEKIIGVNHSIFITRSTTFATHKSYCK